MEISCHGERLHHIGFVVASIPDSAPRFVSGLGLRWDERVYHDPIQIVRVTFLQHLSFDGPQIELIEPAAPESRVSSFLKRGGGLHHLCYEVDSLDGQIELALARGAIMLLPPAQAVAFENRRIAWVCTPDRLLIEYLQRKPRE